MTLPSNIQRIAMAIWPVTVTILLPLIAFEAFNLWRKNRREVQFSKIGS